MFSSVLVYFKNAVSSSSADDIFAVDMLNIMH